MQVIISTKIHRYLFKKIKYPVSFKKNFLRIRKHEYGYGDEYGSR